jgi:hypothetical protein
VNKITEITRRDIIELFREGYVESSWLGDEKVYYSYYGRLTEMEFLGKLYPLDKMPSYDSRFENAGRDIWQHTINNDDWESDWIFKDDRFELLKGSDLVLLNFLCAVFHHENRNEKGYWKEYLEKSTILLKQMDMNYMKVIKFRDEMYILGENYHRKNPQAESLFRFQ